MDTRYTPEQEELRRAARQLARELGPPNVADLDDHARTQRLADAVRQAGWLELRGDTGDGTPLASGVEAAIVAEALAVSVADVGFSGPALAADLARRCGAPPDDGAVVAFHRSLGTIAVANGESTTSLVYAVDSAGAQRAYVLLPGPDSAQHGMQLGVVALDASTATGPEQSGTDLTRSVVAVQPGTPITPVPCKRSLGHDDLTAVFALGLTLTCADLVGAMRGVIDVTVAYAAERRQYGVPIGSFQAVQHLLAEAHCLMEGSVSIAAHAAWAVDNLDAIHALMAARVAKAYCARAARTVNETAVQVYGGIGNTWECIVHVYLRRALLGTQWFGNDGTQLREIQRARQGV